MIFVSPLCLILYLVFLDTEWFRSFKCSSISVVFSLMIPMSTARSLSGSVTAAFIWSRSDLSIADTEKSEATRDARRWGYCVEFIDSEHVRCG